MAYLDHAATTPMLDAALEAYVAAAGEVGNASSLHAAGRRARRRVEESRERVAAALGARPSEVIFTGGGTESDNLAVKGIFWARRAADQRRRRVVSSAVEHHAVLDAVEFLTRQEGAEAGWLPVDGTGRIAPEALAAELSARGDEVTLVTAMWANNEVGTIQPVAELAAVATAHGVPFHTDAVQAVGQVPVDFAASGVSALTVTGHKLGGPTGVGALIVRADAPFASNRFGGGQETNRRAGTENLSGIVGFGAAAEAASGLDATLRDQGEAALRAIAPQARVFGAGAKRLPNTTYISMPGVPAETQVMALDLAGVCVSAGSACSSGKVHRSAVLAAMGIEDAEAGSAIRISFGWNSQSGDIDRLIVAWRDLYIRVGKSDIENARAA